MTTNATWADILGQEKTEPYFQSILQFLANEKHMGKVVYPPENEIFNAFKETPYAQLKVVILGQDPYHGPSQAHGLSFSVKPGVAPPPSLKNIYKELLADLNLPIPNHGCLSKWAHQGVLLLNTALTVEQSKPQSHAKIGWTTFTDNVIRRLNEYPNPLVFLLWGAHAQSKRSFINAPRHLILTAPHPSPLSAHQGFLGCRHFSKTNAFLIQHGRGQIDWRLA
jgi:uracil-DNA glycosylase